MKTYIKTIFICIFLSALCTPVHAQWEKKAAGMIVGKVPVKPAVNLPKEPLLYNMQSEYEISLRAIYASESVYSKLAFYRQTTQALADFIAAHGRRPKRNTADEKEFELLRDIGFALEVTTAAQEEPFAGELKKLRDLWDANEPTFWSLDKTLSVLERFLQKTGPRFPRSLKENPNLPDQEVALYDNLEYWLHKQPILHSTIISWQNKYRP